MIANSVIYDLSINSTIQLTFRECLISGVKGVIFGQLSFERCSISGYNNRSFFNGSITNSHAYFYIKSQGISSWNNTTDSLVQDGLISFCKGNELCLDNAVARYCVFKYTFGIWRNAEMWWCTTNYAYNTAGGILSVYESNILLGEGLHTQVLFSSFPSFSIIPFSLSVCAPSARKTPDLKTFFPVFLFIIYMLVQA